jgi:hypothetical protein
MVKASGELDVFIKNKKIEFCLDFYAGMNDLEVCKEINGKIDWLIELKH